MRTFSFGRTSGELVPCTYRSQRGFVRLCEISTGLIYQRLRAYALLQVNVRSSILGHGIRHVITWTHKTDLFRALRDDPRHTNLINDYKTGIRQLQGPGGPCGRTMQMASSGIAVGIWQSTKVETRRRKSCSKRYGGSCDLNRPFPLCLVTRSMCSLSSSFTVR